MTIAALNRFNIISTLPLTCLLSRFPVSPHSAVSRLCVHCAGSIISCAALQALVGLSVGGAVTSIPAFQHSALEPPPFRASFHSVSTAHCSMYLTAAYFQLLCEMCRLPILTKVLMPVMHIFIKCIAIYFESLKQYQLLFI